MASECLWRILTHPAHSCDSRASDPRSTISPLHRICTHRSQHRVQPSKPRRWLRIRGPKRCISLRESPSDLLPSIMTHIAQRVPHAYTTPSSPDAARCWVPCLDNQWEKCTWEFEFVVPRYLEERTPGDDDDEGPDCTPTMVVCSGELVEQVRLPSPPFGHIRDVVPLGRAPIQFQQDDIRLFTDDSDLRSTHRFCRRPLSLVPDPQRRSR